MSQFRTAQARYETPVDGPDFPRCQSCGECMTKDFDYDFPRPSEEDPDKLCQDCWEKLN